MTGVEMNSFLSVFLIFVSAAFTGNVLLTRFLGMCSVIGVSNKVDTSIGLGLAVTFVTTITTFINYTVYKYILSPLNIQYLRLITFIIIIAGIVQLLEMFVERFSERLYNALGIFLPLITVNCAILGISLFMLNKPYGLLQTAVFGFGSGFGWFLSILLIGGIREKIDETKLPQGLAGPGITLIIIGIMALAFIVFSGMIKI